jgi:hypothetical protein
MTPEQRQLRARMAAHVLHSRVDSTVHTQPARRAFLTRFEDQVDPRHELPVDERRRRAEHALRAHMQGLALKSAMKRRARAQRP